MIVRYGGGNNGIAEYLENGMKQGRMFSRDELDQRLVLQGDLEFTNNIIQSIQDKGQERYLHITLSFKEDEVSFEKMQSLVDDYRNYYYLHIRKMNIIFMQKLICQKLNRFQIIERVNLLSESLIFILLFPKSI